MAFIAPVRFNDGYWMFHDMNETAGIFLQTLGLYSRVVGDRPFFESNEPYIDLFMSNYLVSNDWSWMASNAVEWGMGNNIDMLNAELSGWAGMVRIKEFLGKPDEADFGRYMAAKAGASTGARLLMSEFYNSLNFPIPPHLAPVIHEMADVEQAGRKDAYLPLGVSQGYGEGWPSLWPTSISKGLLNHFIDGKDFYSTSKGVPVELLAFYRSNEALAEPLRKYEAAFRDAAYAAKAPYLYSRTAGNAYLKSPRDRADLERMLYRTFTMPGCSANALGAGLADWETPAMVILLDLLRESAAEDRRAGQLPFGDERARNLPMGNRRSEKRRLRLEGPDRSRRRRAGERRGRRRFDPDRARRAGRQRVAGRLHAVRCGRGRPEEVHGGQLPVQGRNAGFPADRAPEPRLDAPRRSRASARRERRRMAHCPA